VKKNERNNCSLLKRTPKFGENIISAKLQVLWLDNCHYAEKGKSVQQGDDAGFIKFGSRV